MATVAVKGSEKRSAPNNDGNTAAVHKSTACAGAEPLKGIKIHLVHKGSGYNSQKYKKDPFTGFIWKRFNER